MRKYLFHRPLLQLWSGCWWQTRERSSLFLLLGHQLNTTQVEVTWLAKQRFIGHWQPKQHATGAWRHALMGGQWWDQWPSNWDEPVHAYTLSHSINILPHKTLQTDSNYNGSRPCSGMPKQSTEAESFDEFAGSDFQSSGSRLIFMWNFKLPFPQRIYLHWLHLRMLWWEHWFVSQCSAAPLNSHNCTLLFCILVIANAFSSQITIIMCKLPFRQRIYIFALVATTPSQDMYLSLRRSGLGLVRSLFSSIPLWEGDME